MNTPNLSEDQEREAFAWAWIPSKVWGEYVISRDPAVAKIAREMGLDVIELFAAAEALRAVGAEPVAHNDHPLRHFDRTCPACVAEEVTEPVALVHDHTPNASISEGVVAEPSGADARQARFEQDVAAYLKVLPSLLPAAKGLFALVGRGELSGIFESRIEAMTAGYERFGLLGFIAHEIGVFDTRPEYALLNRNFVPRFDQLVWDDDKEQGARE